MVLRRHSVVCIYNSAKKIVLMRHVLRWHSISTRLWAVVLWVYSCELRISCYPQFSIYSIKKIGIPGFQNLRCIWVLVGRRWKIWGHHVKYNLFIYFGGVCFWSRTVPKSRILNDFQISTEEWQTNDSSEIKILQCQVRTLYFPEENRFPFIEEFVYQRHVIF